MSEPWWSGLNEVWSEEKTVYLAAGTNVCEEAWSGDFVFHRFYATDDYDPRKVNTLLVEAQNWNKWNEWLKKHKTDRNTLIPKYVHPIEQVIMDRKSFRIVMWVDEYRPFEFSHDPLV